MNILLVVDNVPVPVIAPVSPELNAEVCFVGGYSGLVCGRVFDLDKTMTRTSP